jgi:hypothetical protein
MTNEQNLVQKYTFFLSLFSRGISLRSFILGRLNLNNAIHNI